MSGPATKSGSINVYPLIILHLLIVVPLAFYLNIWADEASTLYSTDHGIIDAFTNAATVERQAPLYFWFMSVWRSINDSIFFARLFSIICSIAAIKLFAGFVQRLFTWRTALLATAFFALHPILIWASLEIRVYSLVILLSVVLLRFFFQGFIFNDADKFVPAKRLRLWFLVLATVALYTNYYLGFLLVGCFVALLCVQKWRSAWDYLLNMAVAGVAFLPLVFTFKSQFAVNTSGYYEERAVTDGLRRLWDHVLTFVLPADIISKEEPSIASVIRLWLVRIAIVVTGMFAFVRRDRLTSNTITLGAVSLTILGCLLAAYFAVGTWLVALRHASVLFVPLILFFASLLHDLFAANGAKISKIGKFAVPVLGLFVLASFSYALMTLYPNTAKRGDWLRVGAYIQQHESQNQPIIIFHTYDALVLPYQYRGVNRILPDEKYFEYDFGTPGEKSINARTEFTISKIPADALEIWLIENDECKTPGICEQFETYIHQNFDVVERSEFYQQDVRLLRRKQ
jgi:Dolichyl-phosphate-mannose-protein mannosyltransferase